MNMCYEFFHGGTLKFLDICQWFMCDLYDNEEAIEETRPCDFFLRFYTQTVQIVRINFAML